MLSLNPHLHALKTNYYKWMVVLAAGLTLAFLGILAWQSYLSYHDFQEHITAVESVNEANALIGQFDEALTMSARMAAATGDLQWETRYRLLEPQLDQAIQKVKQLAPDIAATKGAQKTDEANQVLVEMECRSFKLIRDGRQEEAKDLLSSREYEEAKHIYANGFQQIRNGLSVRSKSLLQVVHDRLVLTLTLMGTILPLLLALWAWVIREARINSANRIVAENALRKSQNQYFNLVEGTSDLVTRVSADGHLLFSNHAAFEIYGLAPEECIGRLAFDFIHPEDRGATEIAFQSWLKSCREGFSYENRMMGIDGRIHYLAWSIRSEHDENGNVSGFASTGRDITERKRLEEAIQERERRSCAQRIIISKLAVCDAITSGDIPAAMRRLTEEASAAIQVERASVWLLSEDSEILRCIALFEAKTRRHSEGAILRSTTCPSYFEAILAENLIDAGDARKDPRTSEFTTDYLVPLGITSMLDVGIQMGGKVAGVVCLEHVGDMRVWHSDDESFATTIASLAAQSLTNAERRRVEKELLASEGKYRSLFESSRYAIMTIEPPSWRFTSGNPEALKMFGAKNEGEFLSREPWELSPELQPDGRASDEKAKEMIEKAMRDGSNFFEWTHKRISGEEFPATVLLSRTIKQDQDMVLQATVNDITESKRAEEEKAKLEEQNSQLQKSESLGRMSGAIAHHFNNKLNVVQGYLEMVIGALPPGDPRAEKLARALQAAQKASEVSGNLLAYLGQVRNQIKSLDLSEICSGCLPVLLGGMPKNVVLETDLPSPGPYISADAKQVQQILSNLVINAWEAIGEEAGTVRLSVKTVPATDIPASCRHPIGWQPREQCYVCLEVSDSGCGIVEKDMENLFDPFFSTKFTGRGLGLSIVLGIVKTHDAVITVENRVGGGSVFSVFFPLSNQIPIRQPDQVAEAPKSAAGATVLLVEDDRALREMTMIALVDSGFAVLQARDGVEAVEVFRQHRDEISCLLSDLTMPRMGGWETISKLRALRHDLPVILASGYDEASVMKGEHPELPDFFLNKPYDLGKLCDTIRLAIARKR